MDELKLWVCDSLVFGAVLLRQQEDSAHEWSSADASRWEIRGERLLPVVFCDQPTSPLRPSGWHFKSRYGGVASRE